MTTALDDLKAKFGDKKILSPSDIAPLINVSEKVQANLRSAGRFPIPVKKVGVKVGVSIYDLARWLDGDIEETKQTTAIPQIKQRKRNIDKDWITAFQLQLEFENELLICLKKIRLEKKLKKKDG